MCRSNKKEASRLISLRLTRQAKIAAHSMDELLQQADATVAVDQPDSVNNPRGTLVSVDTMREKVLPNGAQYRGARHAFL